MASINEIKSRFVNVEYDDNTEMFYPKIEFVNTLLDVNLQERFGNEQVAKEIVKLCNKEIYDTCYSEEHMFKEDYKLKKAFINESYDNVNAIIFATMEQIYYAMTNGGHRIIYQHGINLQEDKSFSIEEIKSKRICVSAREMLNYKGEKPLLNKDRMG